MSARKVRRGGGQWGSGRTFAFIVLGLGFWVIATMAWPGVYESVLFYARATQTVLLVLVSPLFLAMGKPLTLLIEAYPKAGRRVERAVRSRVAKVVTFPAITHAPARRRADEHVLHVLVHALSSPAARCASSLTSS